MDPRYRCPYPDCNEVFRDPGSVPGRPTRCPSCDRAMNARPLAMERFLQERARGIEGSRGAAIARRPLVALLDNVRSLWNVGSMFRTADACGVAELILAGITGFPPRDAISKTALGAEDAVAWRYRAEALPALRELESEGWTAVALETGPGGIPLPSIEWPERVCLVVGNEVHGVSPEVLQACPLRVSIPMCGVKETLNVAVAFGIAIYEAAKALAERDSRVRR